MSSAEPNYPESAWRLPRRDFLERLLGGAAATAAAATLVPKPRLSIGASTVPGSASAADEAFWKVVKDQFPLRPGFTLLNAANLCPSPYAVEEAVFGLTRDVDGDASFQNRAKFRDLRESGRQSLAAYLGVTAQEIAITRNTTEGNNTVVNGVALAAGDEVVLWDQNHPTNNVSWDVRAERLGFKVLRVKTPAAPRSIGELVDPFRAALTSHTKVLALTHVSSSSGVRLPVTELCALARSRGVLTLVDGAQSFGSMDLDLTALGCDIYTGSAHKWFMGPKEVGVLYVRADRQAALWPNIVGLGWESAKDHGAQKFETLGQRDDAAVSAVGKAVDFHRTVGKATIAARVQELATAAKEQLRAKVPGIAFHTPVDPGLSSGIVIFHWPGLDRNAVYGALYQRHQIGCATTSGDFPGLRFSPHVYNTMDEVTRAVGAVTALASTRLGAG